MSPLTTTANHELKGLTYFVKVIAVSAFNVRADETAVQARDTNTNTNMNLFKVKTPLCVQLTLQLKYA